MELSLFHKNQTGKVVALFASVFADSEGESEGKVIGDLVAELIESTRSEDLMGCMATDKGQLLGCIFFSRLMVPNGQLAFILSPVAVLTGAQGKGIGQALIKFGFDYLKRQGVSLVFTYGDPNYYAKLGFNQISERVVKAPFKLSQPEGWLARSLDGSSIPTMSGAAKCVTALSDPKYW